RHYRPGLDAVARALLEHETIDGAEVKRLIDAAQASTHNGAGPDGTEQTDTSATDASATDASAANAARASVPSTGS
ncbi:MAG: cell division protein FtsH, partial [Acidimicrobiia bacterium]|nr:cell division protein FtsH [Acidimicrobiia bacterium]